MNGMLRALDSSHCPHRLYRLPFTDGLQNLPIVRKFFRQTAV